MRHIKTQDLGADAAIVRFYNDEMAYFPPFIDNNLWFKWY